MASIQIGIGVALAFAPLIWQQMPETVKWIGFFLGVSLTLHGLWTVFKDRKHKQLLYDANLGQLIEKRFPSWVTQGPVDKIPDICREIRQRAVLGTMTVWGRGGANFDFYPLIEIPKDAWNHMQLNWFSVMKGNPNTEKLNQIGSGHTYYDLAVNTAQFNEICPPVRWWRKVKLRSPITNADAN